MTREVSTHYSRHARIRARRSAVQAIYQWLMNKAGIKDIITEFINDRSELKKADVDYFRELLTGTADNSDELEAVLGRHLDRPSSDLDPVEHAILLLGIFELKHRPDLPWRVIINESVELAKMFGADQSHKYINGVMDRVAHEIRSAEIPRAG